MFTSSTRLHTQRPSPTTVLFTASNAPTTRTLTARVVYSSAILLRLVVSGCAVSALALKAQYSPANQKSSPWLNWIPFFLRDASQSWSWELLLPGSILLLCICLRRFHTGNMNTFAFHLLLGSRTSRRITAGASDTGYTDFDFI